MIEFTQGNLLEAPVDALVNTVNTVGVMGKGIALQFRQAYPQNYRAYKRACDRGEVVPGRMFVYHTGTLHHPRMIINFPTKRHWRSRTKLTDVEAGLVDLVRVLRAEHVSSVAIPPLGCGNGGLQWDVVRPRIESAMEELPDVRAFIYAPAGSPDAGTMPVATTRPRMTPGRAAIVALVGDYLVPGYTATLLEIQKLAYFLQTAGQDLRLKFVRGPYGPYAENLNLVLQRIEGHFIRGYGDRTSGASIEVLEGASGQAREFLWDHHDSEQRLKRVAKLIEGFETPYSLELLATLHWLGDSEGASLVSADEAREHLLLWSPRKHAMFDRFHVEVALRRLMNEGWLPHQTGE